MKPQSTIALVNRLVRESESRPRIFDVIEAQERLGYTFENANASLELLIARLVNGKKLPFSVISYHVSMRGSMEGDTKTGHICEASVKVHVGGAEFFEVSEASGPVHALDGAIRCALDKSRLPKLGPVRLVDYTVGLVNGTETGTGAKTCVRIVTSDQSVAWSTMGVSENVVEASLLALIDSLEYAFFRMGARK